MVMGNMSKRQQPDKKAYYSRRLLMGLQHSEKIPHPDVGISWPLNKTMYYFIENG